MLSESDIKKIKSFLYEANSMALWHLKSGLEILYKNDHSPVTNADIAISKYLTESLSNIIPGVPVISEEGDEEQVGDLFWLVDPIDGTKGYIKGKDLYTVNIGLISHAKPIYGFVSQPSSNMLYYTAAPDLLKIEHDGSEYPPSEITSDLKAVISHDSGKDTKEIMEKHGISSYEILSCSIKFCLVASGDADLYPRFGRTMEWDTAAGHALINAAGGKLCDLEGNILTYGKEGLVNEGFIAYSKRLSNKTSKPC